MLEHIIDVMKLIGKRGLSYRGKQGEAAYTLDDNTIDHGNFLEMIVLLSQGTLHSLHRKEQADTPVWFKRR